ncbi:MAG: F0F1 ATP synthase subunit delta [Bacteroidales bacterium]|jgi:F-type H+-transporting ATPase subunit delta|nr:F0F1 ATP synthase subunit delta [Bacteroidales bacterium]
MNTGIISSRYARALLRLVDETGNGEAVYDQVLCILKDPDSMPEGLEPELSHLVALLVKNNRIGQVKFILHRFIELYNASRGRHVATLKTAVPSPELEGRIKELLQDRLGGEIVLHTEIVPSIIGGFTLTVDDRMLDASVSHQLEEIRRQLLDKNKRIV